MTKKGSKVDNQLAKHLGKAEEHLIEAVTLFNNHEKLNRRSGYYTRLVDAQESITTLYREELVRMRGPQRAPGGRRRAKR